MIVKQASLEIFAKKYLDVTKGQDDRAMNRRDIYGFLCDDWLVVNKNDDMSIGEAIIFEITDRAELTRQTIEVSISFIVEEYDSICFKLVKVIVK